LIDCLIDMSLLHNLESEGHIRIKSRSSVDLSWPLSQRYP